MKKLFSLLLLALATHAFAQSPNPQPNDSISTDNLIGMQPAEWLTVDDSLGYIDPIPIPSGPKAPIRPHYVSLNGHILYAYGQFVGYTLYIINEVNAIVYTAEVWADEQAIVLPEWLTGSLTLVFADDDGGCYYGEIEL